MGRPRDRAPDGFATVREAADILGISEQAVRARMDRGTLPERTDVLKSGEPRRYVPREALTKEREQVHDVATREDTAEIHMVGAMLAKELSEELITEMRRNEAALTRTMTESSSMIVEHLNAVNEQMKNNAELLKENIAIAAKRQDRNHVEIRKWRTLAYIALCCLIFIAILMLGEHLGLW